MLDFTKLQTAIPPKGSITFTIKHTNDNKLSVLYQTKHNILEPNSTYDKTLETDKKTIEQASKSLNKIISLKGTADELTATFEKDITNIYQTEKSLADAVNDRTKELNEAIKALKDKKTAKTTPAQKNETAPKVESKKEEKPSLGGLFATDEKKTDPENIAGSTENKGEIEEGGNENE